MQCWDTVEYAIYNSTVIPLSVTHICSVFLVSYLTGVIKVITILSLSCICVLFLKKRRVQHNILDLNLERSYVKCNGSTLFMGSHQFSQIWISSFFPFIHCLIVDKETSVIENSCFQRKYE